MSQRRTLWEEGHEPGRQVVALGLALALTAVVVDQALTGSVGLLFDICFVLICVGTALAVRPSDFFTVGVLPPLLMVVVFGFVAVVARDAIADPRDSLLQAVVSGVATHGIALFVGYALCLGWLAWRLHRRGHLAAELERELGQPAS